MIYQLLSTAVIYSWWWVQQIPEICRDLVIKPRHYRCILLDILIHTSWPICVLKLLIIFSHFIVSPWRRRHYIPLKYLCLLTRRHIVNLYDLCLKSNSDIHMWNIHLYKLIHSWDIRYIHVRHDCLVAKWFCHRDLSPLHPSVICVEQKIELYLMVSFWRVLIFRTGDMYTYASRGILLYYIFIYRTMCNCRV
jgi:hypothetical protein